MHLKSLFVFRVRGAGQLRRSGADEAKIHFLKVRTHLLKDTSAGWMLANIELNPGTSCLFFKNSFTQLFKHTTDRSSPFP